MKTNCPQLICQLRARKGRGCDPKQHSPHGESTGTVPFRPGKTERDRKR